MKISITYNKVKDSQFQIPLSFELLGSRGKVNNKSGVSQNVETAVGGSSLTPKRLYVPKTDQRFILLN